ncbi:MAG: Zn-ribbon domain-containing OB-fold protein [Dehalococcoidales bacterium]|nr:Zn-ribbon domain-containing OB-fold protein [Dehalococcoidales bacterium]
MTEEKKKPYGDPMTFPFWEAAQQHRLLIQHCPACGAHQFYPRPFCLACNSTELEWVEVKGEATIRSMTTVHLQIVPYLVPPYVVAVIELDEGPRMLGNVEGGSPAIGDRIRLAWRERTDAPPLPTWVSLET